MEQRMPGMPENRASSGGRRHATTSSSMAAAALACALDAGPEPCRQRGPLHPPSLRRAQTAPLLQLATARRHSPAGNVIRHDACALPVRGSKACRQRQTCNLAAAALAGACIAGEGKKKGKDKTHLSDLAHELVFGQQVGELLDVCILEVCAPVREQPRKGPEPGQQSTCVRLGGMPASGGCAGGG